MWHQLHSKQYIRLLHLQVSLVILLKDLLFFKFLILPDWEIFTQYLQVLGLLQPLMVVVLGWAISALSNMSLREGGFLYVIMKSCFTNSLVAMFREDQCLRKVP